MCRKSIQTYSKKLRELDEMVKKMVFEGLNLENYLEEHLEATTYHLKVMKYRVADPSESTMGLDSHADTSILTILHQNGIQGLDIRTKDGDWITINVSPNSFVVMAGESFNVSIHEDLITTNILSFVTFFARFCLSKTRYIFGWPIELFKLLGNFNRKG